MSQISRLPLPSISLVLTTDHTRIPRRPSVVNVAPLALPPIEIHAVPLDPMKRIHSREFEARPLEEDHFLEDKYSQSQHVVFVEEVESEDFKLAESILEGSDGERVGIGNTLKCKMLRALSLLRQVFCVELPYTCLCRRPRK